MAEWTNFFFAQVGASAGLIGLIFVGVSINLTKIIASPPLPSRALQALVLLTAILGVSSLMLVPGQSDAVVGIELLAMTAATCTVIVLLDRQIRRKITPEFRRVMLMSSLENYGVLLLYTAGGLSVLVYGASGLYWLVPAMLLSFLKAIQDAWILLIEINR